MLTRKIIVACQAILLGKFLKSQIYIMDEFERVLEEVIKVRSGKR